MEKEVVIAIPVYKVIPDKYEQASLSQCIEVLSKYEFCIFTYRDLDISYYIQLLGKSGIKYKIEYFDEWYFRKVHGYNKLLLSREFYERFSEYKYMLIYQLDAYVFSDELMYWCSTDYDYIGAPWFENFGLTHKVSDLVAVGNGGFSLRKISSYLSVFDYMKEHDKRISACNYWNRHLWKTYYKYSLRFIISRFVGKSNTLRHFQNSTINEDAFWSQVVPEAFEAFKVASIADALRFSFEADPPYLLQRNGGKLPFGCHAWQKMNFDSFWSNYIKPDE